MRYWLAVWACGNGSSGIEEMRLWTEDETTLTGLCALFIPKCKLCGTEAQFLIAKASHFEINDGTGEKNSHHCDIEMWCPNCYLWWVYGVAISPEHHKRINKIFEEAFANEEIVEKNA